GVAETTEPTDEIREHLARGDGRRHILEGDRLPDPGETGRAFLDHDYYYHGRSSYDDDFLPNRHHKRAEENLDRFEIPVEAVVLLVSKNGPDGSGVGVEAEGASGPAKVEFRVIDPPEDTSR